MAQEIAWSAPGSWCAYHAVQVGSGDASPVGQRIPRRHGAETLEGHDLMIDQRRASGIDEPQIRQTHVVLLHRDQLLNLGGTAGDQRYPHLVAAFDEAADEVRQQKHRGAGHGNDTDGAALQIADALDGPLRCIQAADDLACLLEQVVGFRHRVQAATAAHEQLEPDIALETGDQGADGRLGTVEISRRLRNRAGQHDFPKSTQLFEIQRDLQIS